MKLLPPDTKTLGDVLTVMKDLARSGMTMIVVTHELGFAREVAGELTFMDAGLVVERGTPAAMLSRPTARRTQAFLARVLRPEADSRPLHPFMEVSTG